jgi:hypothetical protein
MSFPVGLPFPQQKRMGLDEQTGQSGATDGRGFMGDFGHGITEFVC